MLKLSSKLFKIQKFISIKDMPQTRIGFRQAVNHCVIAKLISIHYALSINLSSSPVDYDRHRSKYRNLNRNIIPIQLPPAKFVYT